MISFVTVGQVTVSYVDSERYEIRVRDHQTSVDQPADSGGGDTAPTPTELFVGSLAACVAFSAGRYLSRHGLGRDGLEVRATFEMATDRPARVARVRITVRPPAGFPPQRIPALTSVASHCTVHNSITEAPKVTITVG